MKHKLYTIRVGGKDADVVPLIGTPPPPNACLDVFDRLERKLRSEGFVCEFLTNREVVLKKGKSIVMLIYDECVIRTNVPLEKLRKYVKGAMSLERSFVVI